MKIAIGFFGITRSLQHTIQSIETNIFDVLKKNAVDFDIFLHTYNLANYKNVRTGEVVKDEDVDNEEYKLLNANFIRIDNQENIKTKLHLSRYRSQKDPWNTKYNSVDNFILGQYSKFILTQMITSKHFSYDFIIFMRPDCLYLDKFPINVLKHKNKNTIVIPNFHLFGPYKFNDRFCIATQRSYKIYGGVFARLLDISKKQPLHSETIIGQIMKNHQTNIIRTKFNFSRVRFNGKCCDAFPKKLPPRKQIIKKHLTIPSQYRHHLLRLLVFWRRWKKRT
jgi:hypothetical protein